MHPVVRRVETALTDAPGVVSARVNLATHSAHVEYQDGATTAADLAQTATNAGYPAEVRGDDAEGAHDSSEADEMKRRVLIAALLTLPVVALAMGGHMFTGCP